MSANYHPLPSQVSCAEAWLAASEYLMDNGQVNSLILHIERPTEASDTDNAIVAEVDALLRDHGAYPISTVANTIFPNALYRPGEPELLYKRYRASFKRVKSLAADWGRYFDRMIRWPATGKSAPAGYTEPNQLAQLIENLKEHGPEGDKSTRYNIYEITLFHPEKDAKLVSNRQCLSFIEIKPEPQKDGSTVLHMTALYRSHYYATRTLGNLIGLGRLLNFIAIESGYKPGSLTIHSTHAVLDRGTSDEKKGRKAWGKEKLKTLIETCRCISNDASAKAEPSEKELG